VLGIRAPVGSDLQNDRSRLSMALSSGMSEHDSAIDRSRETVGLFLGFIGVLCFSVSLPATRVAVKAFNAVFVSFGRAVLAGLAASAVLLFTRQKRPNWSQARRLVWVTAGVVVGFPIFTGLALRDAPAGHGAVVIGLLPAATAAGAVLRSRERPSKRFWGFALMGALAIAVLAIARSNTAELALGDVFFLLAVVSAAVGYTEGALLSRELGGWQTISWAVVLGLPVTLPVTLTSLGAVNGDEAWTAWTSFTYLGLVSMFLGFFAWYAGLAKGGIARVSQVQLIQPLLTVGWSMLFLDESADWLLIVAAVTVLVAVFGSRRSLIKN
jgi:drug/metabolite transporter (DMT)-like permease